MQQDLQSGIGIACHRRIMQSSCTLSGGNGFWPRKVEGGREETLSIVALICIRDLGFRWRKGSY